MEELNANEQAQFKQMQQQDAEDKAAVEQEKIIEQPAQPEPEAPKEPEKDKTVPLSALQEERERRKLAEESKRQSDLNQARLDERIKAINERLQPPQAPKEIPDPEIDALGALKATTEEMKEFRNYREAQIAQEKQRQFANHVMSQAAAKEAEFMKDTPDYGDAGAFLRQSRMNELMALGQDRYTAQQAIMSESLQMAAAALNQGKNPAEMVYSLAKSRGYTKSTSVQVAQPDTDAAKLARIAEGQKANVSLGSLNNTPGKPSLDGKALLAMNDDDFSKWLDKLPTKERSKYLGA